MDMGHKTEERRINLLMVLTSPLMLTRSEQNKAFLVVVNSKGAANCTGTLPQVSDIFFLMVLSLYKSRGNDLLSLCVTLRSKK